jgi:hypothetical protein
MNPPANAPATPAHEPDPHTNATRTVRVCVFELDLTCGHRVTLVVTGWYPIAVDCCDRLGGTWVGDTYVPFAASVEYVPHLLSERYERRPAASASQPARLLDRVERTDEPSPPRHPWQTGGAGRFPERVGAPVGQPTSRPAE